MCVNSYLVTTAYVFLLLAVLSCAMSYVAPFWILFPTSTVDSILGGLEGSSLIGGIGHFYKTGTFDARMFGIAGLWAACEKDYTECGWFWENEFYAEKNLPGGYCICLFRSQLIMFLMTVSAII